MSYLWSAGRASLVRGPGWGAVGLLLVLLTIVGGAILLLHNWAKSAVRPVVVGVVLLMFGSAAIGGMVVGRLDHRPVAGRDVSSMPSTGAGDTAAPVSPSNSSTPSRRSSPSVSSQGDTGKIELALESSVDEQRCHTPGGSGSNWSAKPAQLAKPGEPDGPTSTYPRAFGCPITNTSISGYRDYTVPTDADKLVGVVGIDRDSANATIAVEFSVLANDGTALFRRVATYETSFAVDVDVSNTSRIKLQVRLATFWTHPYERSARAAWADMAFTLKG